VFAALGLGLALPFVLVAFVPALRERLPKPGPWMDRLKRFLAIPMAASAFAALWLLNRQGGQPALTIGIIASIALLFAAYEAGRLQRRGKSGAWGGAVAGLALAAIAFSIVPARTVSSHSIPGAAPWSEARLDADLKQGRPVFVYFTADWCLTCKVNEAAAINRSEVRDAFRKANVEVLAGDWTNGDPAITRFLESRSRAGVPLYLWYRPGKAPEELPQVLTPNVLIDRAQRLKA
jgi:thiol:disulfide interchange protein